MKTVSFRHIRNIPIIAAALMAAIGLGAQSRASVIVNDPSLPALFPPGQYETPESVFATYHGPALTIVLSSSPLRNFGPVNRSPSGGNELENFSSQLNGNISINGSPNQPFNSSGPQQDLVFGKIGNTTGTFNTEMLQLNLSGTSPFGPFMIRESPTLASVGQTTVTNIGGGLYRIDSFFDVFTELSVDGGNSWIPSDTSTHIVLMPEPSAFALAVLGVGLVLRRRGKTAF